MSARSVLKPGCAKQSRQQQSIVHGQLDLAVPAAGKVSIAPHHHELAASSRERRDRRTLAHSADRQKSQQHKVNQRQQYPLQKSHRDLPRKSADQRTADCSSRNCTIRPTHSGPSDTSASTKQSTGLRAACASAQQACCLPFHPGGQRGRSFKSHPGVARGHLQHDRIGAVGRAVVHHHDLEVHAARRQRMRHCRANYRGLIAGGNQNRYRRQLLGAQPQVVPHRAGGSRRTGHRGNQRADQASQTRMQASSAFIRLRCGAMLPLKTLAPHPRNGSLPQPIEASSAYGPAVNHLERRWVARDRLRLQRFHCA